MIHTINAVFKAQQAHKYTLRNSNATQRINKLNALKRCIESYEKEIYAALQQDLRKSEFESAVTELILVYGEIDFAIKNLSNWMAPQWAGKTFSALFAKNRIYHEPKGVCLIISPWNYPFQLTMAPLISAIAAGNCVILKPSELSPETSAIMTRIIDDCFEEEEVACFEGDAQVATLLLNLPFDHIFFTGSTEIGKVVMGAAAKNLTAVTLELGGKSPVIIDETANLEQAATKIAWGKLTNAGQTCIAPDYVLLPKAMETDFIAHYRSAVLRMFYDHQGQINPAVYAKIINKKHFERIGALMEEAVAKGAVCAFGGEQDAASQTINPAVLYNVDPEATVMQEEIFGPVLPLISYQTLEEAIAIVNEKSKPLALYVFSRNKKHVRFILKNTSAGGTCINDVLIHVGNPKLPFGGVNASGMGSCHGYFGFRTFSHERAVVFQSRFSMTHLVYPPYATKSWLLRWLKKLM